jgi:anti-sigma factor (TIGR02949 family)
MSCEKVLQQLSEYLDQALVHDDAILVAQHLEKCIQCRNEYASMSEMRDALNSLPRRSAPAYLRSIIRHRIASQDSFGARLKNEFELRWSRIRTLEGVWYVTRAIGIAMASVCFILTSNALAPCYVVNASASVTPTIAFSSPDYGKEVGINVLRKLGIPVLTRNVKSKAAINDLYFDNFGQNSAQKGKDDGFSVVTEVDRSGVAKIENVLEYPIDQALLNNFSEMINSARCRPASKNGQAVRSRMVMMFSKISVNSVYN